MNFKLEYSQCRNFANTKLMLVTALWGETWTLFEFWSFSRKFDLTQNKFEKLNYLELFVLDLLSNTKNRSFRKIHRNNVIYFYNLFKFVGKKIKLKFSQMKSHISELLPKTTETGAWNPVRSKMKLFAKVINGLKAVTHKIHKENAFIFQLKLLLLVS